VHPLEPAAGTTVPGRETTRISDRKEETRKLFHVAFVGGTAAFDKIQRFQGVTNT
jgi:hypothetical protein